MTAQTLINEYATKTAANSVNPALTAAMVQAVKDESLTSSITPLDPLTYGNLNANVHNLLADGLYGIAAYGNSFFGQPDYVPLNPAVPYECLVEKSTVGAVFIQRITFLSAYEPTNRKLGITYTRVGANLTGAISGGWTPIQTPRTFEVASTDTVTCLDGVPKIITGFAAAPQMIGFEYVPANNAVRNVAGKNLADCMGGLILQVKKQGAGNTTISVTSELLVSGGSWTYNANSLRQETLTHNDFHYIYIDSFLQVWPDNAQLRFVILSTGTDIEIIAPTLTHPTHGATSGYSAKWKMTQVV